MAQRRDDMVDHFLDQDTVVALAHHPDHRLGAGRTYQQPAVTVEPLFAGVDRRLDVGIVERLAAAIAHVLQNLRQRLEAMTDLRHRAAKFLHHREHLQRRDKTIAGGGVVRQNDVTGRLAADIVAAAQHLFEHIAVADLRAHELDTLAFEKALQSEIRHHGGDDTRLGEAAVFLPALRDHREQLVAIDQMSALIDKNDAVGVPSSAMPMSARISRTLRHSASGEVDPHSLLILYPSGSTPMAITSAPSSQSASGTTL